MSKTLTLGSFFDGIGGWLLAAKHAGVNPVWASEIDDFPATVSAHHFPQVKQLGDITKINVDELEPTDIICAGSPCQDLSVAGKREGLAGERSGLFRTAIDIVHRLRERTGKPRYFVWENVPGAFSSNKGNDFRAVLEEITKTKIPMPKDNKWAESGMVEWDSGSLAWRVLDAQYWGVPQRRKRIFLVADFAAENRCAAEVLFVEQSVPRNLEKSGTTGKEATTVAGDGAQASSWCIAGNIINRKDKNGGHHLGVDKDVSFTLNTIDRHAVFAEGEKTYSVQAIGHIVEREKSSTLAARDYKSPRNFVEYQKEVPLYDISHLSDGVREIPKGAVNTLAARMGTGGGNVAVLNEADRQETDDVRIVRRLTVTECERLQGLPDGYTDIEFNGKPAPDSRRYKAIGNGMAQPCADFVIRRIAEVVSNEA